MCLDRDTNAGYVCFESDTNVVQSVASVFPVFFFLVAALVCLTTMTRMIADQRTQIGIMKALGYSSGAIIGKYMFYSGSATVFGCIFGIAAGSFAFPAVVWFGYGLIYNLSGLTFIMDWSLAAGITAANLAVTLLVTWYCWRQGAQMCSGGAHPPESARGRKTHFARAYPGSVERYELHAESLGAQHHAL